MFSRSKNLRLIRISAISLFAIFIVIYAIWRTSAYIRGPRIEIFQPLNGSAIASSTVKIVGRVDRVNSLSLNGKTVFIDEAGDFSETILIFPGMNAITLEARDQFKRDVKTELDLVGAF